MAGGHLELETATIQAGVGEPHLISCCGVPVGTFCIVGTSWGGTMTSTLAFPTTNMTGDCSGLETAGIDAEQGATKHIHSWDLRTCLSLTVVLCSGVGEALKTSG
jgi:hypothetical protein